MHSLNRIAPMQGTQIASVPITTIRTRENASRIGTTLTFAVIIFESFQFILRSCEQSGSGSNRHDKIDDSALRFWLRHEPKSSVGNRHWLDRYRPSHVDQ